MIVHPNANGHLRPGCLSRRGLLFGAGEASIAASPGMGVVIEYQNHQGEPQWMKPAKDDWAYATFAKTAAAQAPNETIKLTFGKVPGGRGGYNRCQSRNLS